MGLFDGLIKFASSKTSEHGLGEIYKLNIACDAFVKTDVIATYTKILTDTLKRTHGLKENQYALLWDNCLQSDSNQGLVTLLANAMYMKSDLFLVYNPSVNILRIATSDEQRKIREDYERLSESPTGIFLSFKNYRRTDMLRLYSSLEHCILNSFNKTVNVAKAVQIKIHELRKSVALSDAEIAISQAKSISEALRNGHDIFCDKNDEITSASPDVTPTEKALTFLDSKRSFYLDLPISYISGLQTPGIGSTGEQDMRAVESGLEAQYFFPIVKPVCLALFGAKVEFKSKDFRQMGSALEALRTFDLDSGEHLSKESKRRILARMFDVDIDEEEKRLKAEEKERESEAQDNNPGDEN